VIKLTGINGNTTYFAPAAIAQVTEAGASSHWHGIRAYVKTFDGKTVEVQETADEVAKAIAAMKATP